MALHRLERVLKEGGRRSVRLESADDGLLTVVKRFSAGSLAAATLDRARAAREHRMLSELSEHGLPVPRPLGLECVAGGWEVRMEWLAGAVAASELLAGRANWPKGAGSGCAALGRLLAALHAAGVDHPDLHSGNALLGGDGRAWAIDFHKARRVRRLRERALLRDLVSLAAGARESTTPRERARFLLAWLAALPDGLRPQRPRAELAREVESAARARRVSVVRKRRARWLRQGTACAAVEREFRGFVRHGADSAQVQRCARTALVRGSAEFAALAEHGVLLVTGLSGLDTRRAWCNAARAEEHGLACARPLAVAFEPRPWVALSVPSTALAAAVPQALRTHRALRSLGELCAALADRGLQPRAAAGALFWLSGEGSVLLGPVLTLEHERRPACGADMVRALALAGLSLAELSRVERAAFAAGLLAGSRLQGRALRVLRAELIHG